MVPTRASLPAPIGIRAVFTGERPQGVQVRISWSSPNERSITAEPGVAISATYEQPAETTFERVELPALSTPPTMSTATTTLSTQEVANRLVSQCREGMFVDAIQELYAPHVVSIGPEGGHGPGRVEGFDNVVNKSIEFGKSLEQVYSMVITDPVVADNFFSVGMHMDIDMAGVGRTQMEEVCVNVVKNGKIGRDKKVGLDENP